MKQRENETIVEYALRRSRYSDKFSTFSLVFSSGCWFLIILIELIAKFG